MGTEHAHPPASTSLQAKIRMWNQSIIRRWAALAPTSPEVSSYPWNWSSGPSVLDIRWELSTFASVTPWWPPTWMTLLWTDSYVQSGCSLSLLALDLWWHLLLNLFLLLHYVNCKVNSRRFLGDFYCSFCKHTKLALPVIEFTCSYVATSDTSSLFTTHHPRPSLGRNPSDLPRSNLLMNLTSLGRLRDGEEERMESSLYTVCLWQPFIFSSMTCLCPQTSRVCPWEHCLRAPPRCSALPPAHTPSWLYQICGIFCLVIRPYNLK